MKNKQLSRRQLLGSSLLLGAGSAAFGGGLAPMVRLAQAGSPDAPSDRYYIFCYFAGGWDILISLDPRNPREFTEANVSETMIYPAYHLMDNEGHKDRPFWATPNMYIGPYMGDMAKHASKFTIVRGMSMETLSHQAGMRRFLTGKAPSGLMARGSSASTWLAGLLGTNDLIPNLSVGVEAYNTDLPASASALRVSNIPDLIRALQPQESPLADAEEQEIDWLLSQSSLCPSSLQSPLWQQAELSRNSARDMVGNGLHTAFDFSADTEEMAELRMRYGIGDGNGMNMGGNASTAAAAVRSITSGISRVCSIRLTGGLDTHGDNWMRAQGPRQESGWNLIARMIEDLESQEYGDTGSSWLDHTTIVAFSEFSRTARLNQSFGRDHALTNACLVAGGRVRGGRTIGASSDVGLGPRPTNLQTGAPDSNGIVIKPEHILQSLMVDAGLTGDPADLRCVEIPALFR